MSYDISFRVKVEGIDVYVDVGSCDANITWNVKELIKQSSGWEIFNEQSNGLIKDITVLVDNGLQRLISNPNKYKQYEAPNGWGTVEGVIRFYSDILEAWKQFKLDYPELVDVAVLWAY